MEGTLKYEEDNKGPSNAILKHQKSKKEESNALLNPNHGGVILKPLLKLIGPNVSVYAVFLGSICLLFASQLLLINRNESVFTNLDDLPNATTPFQSVLVDQQQQETLGLTTASKDLNIGASDSSDALPDPNGETKNLYGAKDGIFFSNTPHDYTQCTSPESDIAWPLEGDSQSMTSNNLTCGFGGDSLFANFFTGDIWKRKFEPLTAKCKKLAVFGVAFGGNFVADLDAPHVRNLINATSHLNGHGRCFFILTSDEDIENNAEIIEQQNSPGLSFIDPVNIGHLTLIPLPSSILPYRNPRRNVKLLKYVGQYMFPETETVIWQDAKFFRSDFVSMQPVDYHSMVNDDICVSAFGLPIHKVTVGIENIKQGIEKFGRYTAQYRDHCSTIIAALAGRPDVTDSVENLINQCDAYLQYVYKHNGNVEILNQGLLDSAFIVWNHKTKSCRDFSRKLRCTIADQIQCHADRDQVSIPFAMHKMGITSIYRERKGAEYKKVDSDWDSRIHDIDFIDEETPSIKDIKEVKMRITRSSCHWYFSRLGNCRTDLTEDKTTIALLIAGSVKKFTLSGLAEHFIKPLVEKQNAHIDFYGVFHVKQGLAYRGDGEYTKYQTFDPTFQEVKAEKDSGLFMALLFQTIRKNIYQSGANVGGVQIQPLPLKLEDKHLKAKQNEAKKARPKEDSYYRFPTLDLRPEFRRRTAVENRLLLKRYLGIQKLWDKHLVPAEALIGVQYDYVMVLSEDVSWIADFDLQKLIDTNPKADAYVLSCDQSDPPMIPYEYNDIGIVIKRDKAKYLGRYFFELLSTNLQKCHDRVEKLVPTNTGCNNGMLLYYVFNRRKLVVQKVSPSVFPIQHSYNLKTNNSTTRCLYNLCQSSESPLRIPDNMKSCSEIVELS